VAKKIVQKFFFKGIMLYLCVPYQAFTGFMLQKLLGTKQLTLLKVYLGLQINNINVNTNTQPLTFYYTALRIYGKNQILLRHRNLPI
jgi:hypothetical protein